MIFSIFIVWREPIDHSTDCYFCLTDIKSFTSKSKRRITYPNVISAMRPVLHSEEFPIPFWENVSSNSNSATNETINDDISDDIITDPHSKARAHWILIYLVMIS